MAMNRAVFFLFSVLAGFLMFFPGAALAGTMGGSMEFVYSTSVFNQYDATGLSNRTEGTNYFQRYNLGLTSQLYPYTTLMVGGYYDQTNSTTESSDGTFTRSKNLSLVPNVSLIFGNPVISSGVSYAKREDKSESGAAPPFTTFQETKNAFLYMRPEGLPLLSLQFTRTDRYDKERISEDTRGDHFGLNSQYVPVKDLNISYTANVDKTLNRLEDSESTSHMQAWRASYGTRFLQDRVSFSTDYLRSHISSESNSGSAGLRLARFPFSGLSGISLFTAAPPATASQILIANQAVIDGNLTASTGMNIGQSVSQGGDTRFREVGMDFVNTTTSVNALDVYITTNQPTQSIAGIASNFRWHVYISADNDTWTLFQSDVLATFDSFANRFELSINPVAARYLMVMVQPLSIAVVPPTGVDISNIYITELQAFQTTPSTLRGSSSSQTSELYDVNVRATILNAPLVFYNMTYSHSKTMPGYSTYTFTNSLTWNQQLTRIVTASAVASMFNSGGSVGASSKGYRYSAGAIATPLPTLRGSLSFGGNRSETGGVTSDSNSLFASGSAQLYRGVDVSATAGMSRSSTSTGTDGETTSGNAYLGIVPNRDLTLTFGVGKRATTTTSNGVERKNDEDTAGASVSYRPVPYVYLFYSMTTILESNAERQTTQSYSASWSPFASGELQLSLAYNENEVLEGGTESRFDRTKSVGLSWRINYRMMLSGGYGIVKAESGAQINESRTTSADFTMQF